MCIFASERIKQLYLSRVLDISKLLHAEGFQLHGCLLPFSLDFSSWLFRVTRSSLTIRSTPVTAAHFALDKILNPTLHAVQPMPFLPLLLCLGVDQRKSSNSPRASCMSWSDRCMSWPERRRRRSISFYMRAHLSALLFE